jgi:hypothetical protein
MRTYLSTKPMQKRMIYCLAGGLINHRDLRSECPLILLVAPIAFVQAPSYLLAHRGIGGRDNDALLSEDLAASRPDREVF